MAKPKSDYCARCSILVAPSEPNRQTVGKFVLHGKCYKQQVIESQMAKALRQEELVLKGVNPVSVH